MESYPYGYNGKMKTDELYGTGNAYDFGERMYDPRLGRWMSVDKLAKQYTPISPYAFALNTPIKLKDGDGNVVVDGEGNPVIISLIEGGDGKYIVAYQFAEGTSEETRNAFFEKSAPIIQSMSANEVGRSAIQAANESKNAIEYKYVKGQKGYLETDPVTKKQKVVAAPNANTVEVKGVTLSTHNNGNGELPDVEVLVFEETIKDISDPKVPYAETYAGHQVITSAFSLEENVGATSTHETTHATDPASNSNYRDSSGKPNKPGTTETNPRNKQIEFYKKQDEGPGPKRVNPVPPTK